MKAQLNGIITVDDQEYLQFTPVDNNNRGILTLKKQKRLLELLASKHNLTESAAIIDVDIEIAKIWLDSRESTNNRSKAITDRKLCKGVSVTNCETGITENFRHITDAARFLGFSTGTIRKYRDEGKAYKGWLICRGE